MPASRFQLGGLRCGHVPGAPSDDNGDFFSWLKFMLWSSVLGLQALPQRSPELLLQGALPALE